MAKRRARGGFNLSAALRDIITANPAIGLKDALSEMKAKHPRQKINENSASQSFYMARRQAGGKGRRRKVTKRKPTAQRVTLDALTAAAKFLAEIGDADKAIAAIRQVQSLQIR